jgi:N-acetylated-alpha-linked acidic dipeptidase
MNKYSLIFVFTFLVYHVSATPWTNADWEQQLLSIPRPKNLRGYLYDLTRHAHVAGTKGDYEDAHYVYDKFKAFGLEDVKMDKVRTMLSYPKQQAQLFSSFYRAKLAEDILAQDETSDTIWRNHTFLAYSPPGSVTAKLVYANFGRPQDFQALVSLGVSVKGAIVIMRYGECFRGL